MTNPQESGASVAAAPAASPFAGMGFPGVTPRKGKIVYIDGKKHILDENGKPCQMCTSLDDFQSFTSLGKPAAAAAAAATTTAVNPPAYNYDAAAPDSASLGRATWTFLHSLAATYPERATAAEQRQMASFLAILGNVYPCWYCAEDFRGWMAGGEDADKNKVNPNEPKLAGRDEFGDWMCRAHNAVNDKLGKPLFDCAQWQRRWIRGWTKKQD